MLNSASSSTFKSNLLRQVPAHLVAFNLFLGRIEDMFPSYKNLLGPWATPLTFGIALPFLFGSLAAVIPRPAPQANLKQEAQTTYKRRNITAWIMGSIALGLVGLDLWKNNDPSSPAFLNSITEIGKASLIFLYWITNVSTALCCTTKLNERQASLTRNEHRPTSSYGTTPRRTTRHAAEEATYNEDTYAGAAGAHALITTLMSTMGLIHAIDDQLLNPILNERKIFSVLTLASTAFLFIGSLGLYCFCTNLHGKFKAKQIFRLYDAHNDKVNGFFHRASTTALAILGSSLTVFSAVSIWQDVTNDTFSNVFSGVTGSVGMAYLVANWLTLARFHCCPPKNDTTEEVSTVNPMTMSSPV